MLTKGENIGAEIRPSFNDVELQSVSLKTPLTRSLGKQDNGEFSCGFSGMTDELVQTSQGEFLVSWKGNRTNPALVTFHDLGLNAVSNFQAFLNYPDASELLQHFCLFCVNAPGQEDGAPIWPDDKDYPSMTDLSEAISEILNHFAVVRYIGVGVGMGGNILLRHALKYPERVDSLMLVNTLITAAGWIEWGYQKKNISQMRQHGVTQAVLDYLMWHHFGTAAELRSHDLVSLYQHYFSNEVQGKNLAKLAEQYIWRTAIDINRDENFEGKGDTKTLKVPILNVVGAYSPFVDETVTLNGSLNPVNTNWIKIQDAAMVLEEQPGKITEALLLFMQGQGYCLRMKKQCNQPL